MAFEATDILMCMHNHDAADARGDTVTDTHMRAPPPPPKNPKLSVRTYALALANTQQGADKE